MEQHTDTFLDRASLRMANSKAGIGVLSFGESTVVPIPLEAIILPLMVAWPKRAWAVALAALVGCVLGASLFYFVGKVAFEPIVAPLLERLSLQAGYLRMLKEMQREDYFWAVFLVSLGPAPMQLATLGTGATEGGYPLFLAAIAASRFIRYFGLALLCNLLGERVRLWHVAPWTAALITLSFLVLSWLVIAFVI